MGFLPDFLFIVKITQSMAARAAGFAFLLDF
jgi:hypothetical protein